MKSNQYGQVSLAEADVRIIASDIYPYDGIGQYILGLREQFVSSRCMVRVYATRCDPSLAGCVQNADGAFSSITENTVFIYHLSNFDPLFEIVAELDTPNKILYYHNITPPKYFEPYLPDVATLLESGRALLPLACRFKGVIANSSYSLQELAPFITKGAFAAVFPPIALSSFWNPHAEVEAITLPCNDGPILLSVGRRVPHKQLPRIVRLFGEIVRQYPAARLVHVGGMVIPAYEGEIIREISMLGANCDRVMLMEKLTPGQLAWLFTQAAGFICMSEHEGFCIPLIEAMAHGVPVFAEAQPAVIETVGIAGQVYLPSEHPRMATDIAATLRNPSLSQRVGISGMRRASELLAAADGSKLLGVISSWLGFTC